MSSIYRAADEPLEGPYSLPPGDVSEEIPFGVWMSDPDGGLCYASDCFLALLGMSMEEAAGFGWTARIASEDEDSINRWKLCVEQERNWDDEHRIRSPQGKLHTMIARGHAVRSEDGTIERWIGVHLDITERKQAERRVEDARNFTEAIIDTTPDPLIVLDAQHRVISANQAFYRQFETQQEKTEGISLFELGDGQWDIPTLRTLLHDVLAESTAFDDYRVEHDFPTIGRKIMLVNGRRLLQEGERSETIVLAIRDITAAQQKQDRLRIIQETQAVQRERHRLAHRLHDHMQQLLHAASLHVSLVQQSEPQQENTADLEKVQDLLHEAANAARDLAVDLTPPVLLESGLGAAISWLADWVKDKHRLHTDLEVEPELQAEDEPICLLLFDAVRELLLNIVKHAQVDSAAVKAGRGDGDTLVVIVKDEGIGFDVQKIESADNQGTGLGLPDIRRRIENLGGSFDIQTGRGNGTTTTIQVPLRQKS